MNNNTAYRKENKGTLTSKKVLLKKDNQGKLLNKNDNIKNNFIEQIEEEANEDNLSKPKIEEIQMNEEGYLDDDLKDEENKKIYLRVIKRLEKTLGIPVIGICTPYEPDEDIGIEEDIRPILLDNNISGSYNNNYIGEKEINIKSEFQYGQKDINNAQLNKRNIDYNELTQSNDNNEREIRKEEERNHIINKPIINNKNTQKQYIQIRNNINQDSNISINDRDKDQRETNIIQERKEDYREIKNNNKYNKDIKNNSNINQNLSSSENKYTRGFGYIKEGLNQQSNISASSKINRNASDDNFRNQKNISRGDNNQIYLSNSQILISSQNNEMKPYKKVLLKNPKYHNVSKSIDFNTIVYPDMRRGKDVCIDEQESNISSGKIRITKFIRGGKYNNIQTTYVVYSKKNKNSDLKFNKSPLANNNRNQNIGQNQSNLLYKSTPVKANAKSFSAIDVKNSNNISRYNNGNFSKNQNRKY